MTNVVYFAVAGLGIVAILAIVPLLVMNASAVRVPHEFSTADLSLFGLGLAGMLIRRNGRC